MLCNLAYFRLTSICLILFFFHIFLVPEGAKTSFDLLMEFGFAGVGLASWMQTADKEEEGSSGLSFTLLLHCRTVVSLLFLNPQNLFQAFIIATSL